MISPGTRIGPYEVLDRLGAGGGGEVYRARSTEDDRAVALKVVKTDAGEISLKRFRREVQVLSALSDPHIVRYVGADLENAPPYLATELIEGESLASHIATAREAGAKAFPLGRTAGWALDMARGLATAHRQQVLHRDLKPSNVMVDTGGKAILIDFGLAMADGTGTSSLTGSQELIGTLKYLSPEHIHSRPRVPASDVYQWALVVYEMLIGGLPYPELDMMAAISKRCAKGIGPMRSFDGPLGELASMIGRCLVPDAQARPVDGTKLVEQLEAISVAPARPQPLARASSGAISRSAFAALVQPSSSAIPRPSPPDAARPSSGAIPRPVVAGRPPATGDRTLEPAGLQGASVDETLPEDLVEKIQPWRIVRFLGKGGMGSVYEARHPTTGERVAVKLIHSKVATDEKLAQRFEREGKLLVSIQSPYIVRLLDVGRIGSQPYLVMEYLEGQTLADRIEQGGPIPLEEALDILIAVTSGVADLHHKAIVHRDLKPANVMLTPRGAPRILDLGIARDLSSTQMTRTGESPCTPLYASPETLMGSPATQTSDVFQLGLLAYESLTGRRDFRSPDVIDTLRGFLVRDRRLLSARGELFLTKFLEVFGMCVAAEVARRFPDASRLRKALTELKKLLKELSGPTAPKTPLSARPASPVPAKPAPPPGSRLGAVLGKIGRIVALCVLFAVIGIATVVVTVVWMATHR